MEIKAQLLVLRLIKYHQEVNEPAHIVQNTVLVGQV